MNKITIIGNLTKDPDLRTTPAGKSVVSFTVAVNRKRNTAEPETDFFRVTAWDKLAENCGQFLKKGNKVAVFGSVNLEKYTAKDGKEYSYMNVNASDVEFLTPKNAAPAAPIDEQTGMEQVFPDSSELPF